ncbi:MAG: hypothetical protein AB7V32_04235 [Candidatus Berkiella sp.]
MKVAKNINNDAFARAKRTRSARKFAGLTMEKLNIHYKIPPSTLQGWENLGASSLKNRSLTEKGAHRLIQALLQEGVECSVEWLLHGTGLGPRFRTTPLCASEKSKNVSTWDHHLVIQKEIQFFEDNNVNSVVIMLTDDGLEPIYKAGEYVGGIKTDLNHIGTLDNCFCIVETIHKEIFIRKLSASNKSKTYSLLCINPNTSLLEPTQCNVKLNWAAPIIWHRKVVLY